MSQEKPNRDLITLRDHARERANWQPGRAKWPCVQLDSWFSNPGRWFSNPGPPRHNDCPGQGCGCGCHAVTDAERELWRRLADEIDNYLAGPGEQETLL